MLDCREGFRRYLANCCASIVVGLPSKRFIEAAPCKLQSKKLLQQYLHCTFSTGLDPLKVTNPAELQRLKLWTPWFPDDDSAADDHYIRAHSLGFCKGQARSLTLLSFLLECYEQGIDLASIDVALWDSIRCIYCHALKTESMMELGQHQQHSSSSSRSTCSEKCFVI